jgi:hypothetical protein
MTLDTLFCHTVTYYCCFFLLQDRELEIFIHSRLDPFHLLVTNSFIVDLILISFHDFSLLSTFSSHPTVGIYYVPHLPVPFFLRNALAIAVEYPS